MLVAYTFEIDERVKDKMEKIANDEKRSLASQMRIAIEEYVENHK